MTQQHELIFTSSPTAFSTINNNNNTINHIFPSIIGPVLKSRSFQNLFREKEHLTQQHELIFTSIPTAFSNNNNTSSNNNNNSTLNDIFPSVIGPALKARKIQNLFRKN